MIRRNTVQSYFSDSAQQLSNLMQGLAHPLVDHQLLGKIHHSESVLLGVFNYDDHCTVVVVIHVRLIMQLRSPWGEGGRAGAAKLSRQE